MKNKEALQSVSVSLPSVLVAQVRALVGKRGFSAFVTQAVHHELQSIARKELVDAANAFRGRSATRDELEHARQILSD